MARRGRFGRSETGASDLSATIRSLVRQQIAQEEQVFMKAFYDGTEYGGKIPTMEDVISFYERLGDLAGIDRTTEDWTAILQKIGDANNFDIRRTYNALVKEFDLTGGSNFAELMGFLNGRAKTSTDAGDLSSYAGAIKETSQAYIIYKGKSLVNGSISVEDYRSLVGDLLNIIGKDDPNYYDTMVAAYSAEWTSEKTKWDDKLRAGRVTVGQYTNWANSFRKQIISAGVDKDSTLFTGTLAAIAVARGSGTGGTSPARTRYNKTVDSLSLLWDTVSQSLGYSGTDDAGQAFSSEESVLEKIRLRPEFAAEYSAYIDDNPGVIPQTLRDKGVTDGASFLEYYDSEIKKLGNSAESAYVVGALPKSSLDKVYSVQTVSGSISYFDELKIAGKKWIDDRVNAKGSEQLLEFYDKEYRKYLNGDSSYYGSIPKDVFAEQMYPETNGYRINELAKLDGKGDPNATGITNFGKSSSDREAVNGITSAVKPTADAASAIRRGLGVQEWDETTGEWKFLTAMQGAGLEDGTYQYVRTEKLPDGSGYYSYTAVARGTEVFGPRGATLVNKVWRYLIPDGNGNNTVLIADASGNEYDPNSISQAGGVWVVRDIKKDFPTPLGSTVTRHDYSAAMPDYDRTIGAIARSMGENEGMPSPGELLKIQKSAQTGLLAIDPVTQVDAAAEIQGLSTLANQERARSIATSPNGNTPESQLEIIRLTIGEDSQEYRDQKWIVDNKANLVQIGPYDWRFKSDYQATQNQGLDPLTSSMAGFVAGAPSGALVGAPLGPGGIGAGALIGGIVGAVGGLGASLVSGATPNPQFEALAVSQRLKPQAVKDSEKAMGLRAANAQQYQQTGYAGGSDIFFRNIKQVTGPTQTGIQPFGYLGSQATAPMPRGPAIPAPMRPTPIGLGSASLQSFGGDSLKERRLSALRAATPTSMSVPLSTAGKGGGGK